MSKRYRGEDAPAEVRSKSEIMLDLLVAIAAPRAVDTTATQLGHIAQAIAMHKGLVADSVIVAGILACAKELPAAVHVYAALVGVLYENEATRHLADTVMRTATSQLSPSLLLPHDRSLLLLLMMAWQAAALSPESDWIPQLLLSLATPLHSKEAACVAGGHVEHRALLSAWLVTQVNISTDARAVLLARLGSLKRQLALDDAPLASDRTNADNDRLSFALAALSAPPLNDEYSPASLALLSRFQHASKPASPDLLGAVQSISVGANSEDAFLGSLMRVPIFAEGRAPDDQNKPDTALERFLFLETALSLMWIHEEPAACAKALGAISKPYQVVEALISQMLCTAPFRNPMFFAHVLVDMCMDHPNVLPVPVEDAIDRLISLNMDLDWSWRICDWLVAHLTAFNLDWPWVKWVQWDSLSPSTQAFVSQTLQRLEAVMDRDELLSNVPEEISSRALETVPETTPDEVVVAKLRAKPSPEEMLAFASERFDSVRARVVPLVEAAVHLGRVSYTHMRMAIERIAPALVNEDVGDSFLEAIYIRLPGPWAAVATGVAVDCDIVTKTLALRWLLADSTWVRLRAAEDVLARGEALTEAEFDALVADADPAGRLFLARRRISLLSRSRLG